MITNLSDVLIKYVEKNIYFDNFRNITCELVRYGNNILITIEIYRNYLNDFNFMRVIVNFMFMLIYFTYSINIRTVIFGQHRE